MISLLLQNIFQTVYVIFLSLISSSLRRYISKLPDLLCLQDLTIEHSFLFISINFSPILYLSLLSYLNIFESHHKILILVKCRLQIVNASNVTRLCLHPAQPNSYTGR